MFKTKSTQESIKAFNDYFSAFPKTQADFKATMEKASTVIQTEVKNTAEVFSTYQKAAIGDASINEIVSANKLAAALLISARFATILTLPGAVFALPAIAKYSDEYDLDLIPASVKKAFSI